MADQGPKIRCRKCKRAYYNPNNLHRTCPYCARDALIPNGTIAILNMTIRPGGFTDNKLCLEDGMGTQAKSGAIYLKSIVSVINGPQKDKKFSIPIGISSPKSDYWQHKGRELIRDILNSSQGLSASDNSRKAVYGRIIKSYDVLSGICFVGEVGIRKNNRGLDENDISKVLSREDDEYQKLIATAEFVPTQKAPPPSEPSSPTWRHA